MIDGKVEVHDLSRDRLRQLLGDGTAVNYLWDYLAALSATSLIYEHPYVDRHYLGDFASYYALSFHSPKTWCGRVHLFSGTDSATLGRVLGEAYGSSAARNEAEQILQRHYLGFVVQRPLPGCSIGRTVLKTYPDEEKRRHYEVVRPYVVNLAGLRMKINGLAYQQQDRGAAVCASTALWVAMQRVSYVMGKRSPTPSAITEAAGSPFPASHGLELRHMARSLARLGYIADHFSPAENRALFRALLAASLDSQLPVILLLTKKRETGAGEILVGHAVTATGYSEPGHVVDVPSHYKGADPIPMTGGSLEVLYVHDDNLGSHAHYELLDSDEEDEVGHKKLKLKRGRTGRKEPEGWQVDEWDIFTALVPKPDKLRLSLAEIVSELLFLRRVLLTAVQGMGLSYSMRFDTGVDYKRSLVDQTFEPRVLSAFQQTVSFPRYIGVISVFNEEGHRLLCDIILDASEVRRNPAVPNALAIVAPGIPGRSRSGLRLHQLCGKLKWGVITSGSQP